MQIATSNSLVLMDSSFSRPIHVLTSIKQGEFYQQIAQGLIKDRYAKEALHSLGERLIVLAHSAYACRQMDVVEQLSQMLLHLPLAGEFKSIALYYQAFCIKRKGRFDEARTLFEQVAEQGPLRYRARAMIALGSIAFDSGDFKMALSLYAEGCSAATRSNVFDPLSAVYAQHTLALLKSVDGDHPRALTNLEALYPLARAVGSSYPPIYYNYLNSLAVEMIEVERIEEAQSISRIVLATPYASAYPEWRETRNDLALKGYKASQAFVSFYHSLKPKKNLLHLPAIKPDSDLRASSSNVFQQQGSVTNIQEWKSKMVKEPNDKSIPEDATEKDLFLRLMELVAKRDLTTKQLHQVIDFVEKISSKSDSGPEND